MAWDEALVVYLCAVIECMDVGNHLPCVASCTEKLLDKFILPDPFRPGDFDCAINRLAKGDTRQRGRDIIGHNGLHENGWYPNGAAFGGKLGNAPDELEKLCCANNGMGNLSCLDQLFLSHLRAEITARQEALRADDGKGHVMFHSCGCFGGKEIAA